jgi:hypothetical protein
MTDILTEMLRPGNMVYITPDLRYNTPETFLDYTGYGMVVEITRINNQVSVRVATKDGKFVWFFYDRVWQGRPVTKDDHNTIMTFMQQHFASADQRI